LTLWYADPPQGKTSEQGLQIIGKPISPRFDTPQGIGAVGAFILDQFPGAAFAFSLRQLRTDYLGPSIRVRRSSDNAEQDIGFLANGNLDVSSMVSFVGANDGIIRILYDQSGNDIHLDANLVDLFLPRIIISGTLQLSNTLPSMFFDGLQDIMTSTNSLTSPASHLFVFGVWQKTDLADNPANFNLVAPSTNPNRVAAFAPLASGEIVWAAGNNSTERLSTAFSFNDILQHVWTFTKTAGTDRQIIKLDGVQLAAKTQVSSSTPLDKIALGNLSAASFDYAAMQFQELIFYDTDKFSSIENIENNLLNYWHELTLTAWVDDLGNSIVDDLGNTVVVEL